MGIKNVFVGKIIHTYSFHEFEYIKKGVLGVSDDGTIAFLEKDSDKLAELSAKYNFPLDQALHLQPLEFLIPGYIDTHNHAPQYTFTGTALDLELLDWLNRYTFPAEARFKDPIFAENAYDKAVRRQIRSGTTTVSYYGTLHLEATKILADVVEKYGQRAYIGKVNMNRNCPDYLSETEEESIAATEAFIDYIEKKNNPLITACITPRFAPSCTSSLMTKLGELAKKHNLPVQTHLDENRKEIDWVRELCPEADTYAGVYAHHGLLTDRCILGHCVWLSEKEKDLIKEHGAGISHCPGSNFNLASGVANIKQYVAEGLKCGLGTDVAGGSYPSIVATMREAMHASKVLLVFGHVPEKPLGVKEAIYLATLGSAEVMGLDKKIGNFVPGKDFDALLIDIQRGDVFDVFPADSELDVLEKYITLGDDRNIQAVFVAGKVIHGYVPTAWNK